MISRIILFSFVECPFKPLPRVRSVQCGVCGWVGGVIVCVNVCGRLLEVRWKDYKESPLRVAITAKRRRQSDAPGCLPGAEECLERAKKEAI